MKATFAAGCFWGVEEAFRKVNGVTKTMVGYSGGKTKEPSYRKVCTGITGHAEAVEVTFDPKKISYKQLLKKFWLTHNPTQGNRQGLDIGSQYRSAIFYHNKKQKEEAEQSKKEEQKKYTKLITTEIISIKEFYKAEEYHQQYIQKKSKKKSLVSRFFR
jgi:peptide-methionine (S)-S-oxide reductase